MLPNRVLVWVLMGCAAVGSCFAMETAAAELFVGAAKTSITPNEPVALWGQLHTRISTGVESPVMASVVVLESREGEKVLEQAALVTCDLVAIPDRVRDQTRAAVQKRLPDFPVHKIVLSATHTHTAPVLIEGIYDIPKEGCMQVEAYIQFFAEQTATAIEQAWNSRQVAKVGWGLGQAAVGQNRRAVYEDGTAVMYGKTDPKNFRMIEGFEDHDLNVLFFWDAKDKLIATAINVPCPAQEVEGNTSINADFWHPVRETLQAKYGPELVVLTWTGAAGDQAPHLMYRKAAEERMRKLRGTSRLQEIARRIVRGWEEVLEAAQKDKQSGVVLRHEVESLILPRREVTTREWELAKASVEEYTRDKKNTLAWWHQQVVDRYERQQAGAVKPFEMELHVLRLGDIAIATNAFELFADFGIQIQSRSPALQTFVVQLSGPGNYLPSQRAVNGGGYSAIVQSNEVGPEAGLVLVERTVERVQGMWRE